jgi:hypothetical protein
VKRLALFVCCVLALPLPSPASADEPSLAEWAKRRVEEKLVKPLRQSESEGSRFSRGRPPPRERRVRVTQATTTVDKRGRAFVPFAIDVRFGSGEWRKDDIVGCAYRDSGELFIKSGDAYRPAAFLLGQDLPAVPGACEPAPPRA